MSSTGETSSGAPAAAPQDLAAQVRGEIEKALRRGAKGLELIGHRGPRLGATPRDLLHRRGTYALYRYRPLADELYRVPVLIVMAVTNRGYILDLVPGQSLIEFLLTQGYDVFMIDWDTPRSDEKTLTLEDYVLGFLPDAVRRVQQSSGELDVNLVGYCMGGLLSTLYAALHAEGPVKGLVTFTTPIDFTHMPLFHAWSDRRHFDVDRLIDNTGNAPPDLIYRAFDMLRPADRIAGAVHLVDKLLDDDYVRGYRMLSRWGADVLPVPGELFRQLVKQMMWDNALMQGRLKLGGRSVDLGAIGVPLLHAVAEHDHIVPYAAASPLVAMAGSADKQELVLKGGHVSLVAGANAIKRLWPRLDAWLGKRST
jgi:polyhydroxyalkanoate synthase